MSEYDVFQDWANGHVRLAYTTELDEAKRHASGWAMRNTNNHNVQILKKSCLGVVVCSLSCTSDQGHKVDKRFFRTREAWEGLGRIDESV